MVCDEAVESHFMIDGNKNFAYNHVNMLIMINKYFDKREVQKKRIMISGTVKIMVNCLKELKV